jgi:hypothetical protein
MPRKSLPFWQKVDKSAPDGCWLWLGSKQFSSSGFYGRLRHGGRHRYAHRIAYEELCGPVDKKMHLDHLCRNTLCVNPDHLQPVTSRQNVLRGVGLPAQNARLVVARCGHPFTMIKAGGARICEPCYRQRYRQRYWEMTGRTPPPKKAPGTAKCGHRYDCYRTDGSRACSQCMTHGNTPYSADEWHARCTRKKGRSGRLVPLDK